MSFYLRYSKQNLKIFWLTEQNLGKATIGIYVSQR